MEKRNEQITTKERSLRENDIYWKWQKEQHKKMDTEVIHLERELITSYYLSCMNIRITLLNLNKSPSSSMIFTGRGPWVQVTLDSTMGGYCCPPNHAAQRAARTHSFPLEAF